MSVQSFIFGPGQKFKTQEELERARELVKQVYGGIGTAQGPGGWFDSLAKGVVGNVLDRRIAKGQGEFDASRAAADDAFVSGMAGIDAPAYPAGVAAGGSTMPTESGDYFSKIRTAESSGNDSAKNPLSSATGRYQFTTGTWNQLAKQNPQLGLTPDGRNDPEQQERAIRAFTSQNAGVLGNSGIEATNPNLYAAHFLGAGGATKVLSQADNAPVASIVGQSVVKANPFLANMTVGDFKNWTAKKVGDNGGGVQVASLDPSAGMAEAGVPSQPQNGTAQTINQIAPQQNNYPEAGKVPPVDWTDQPQLSQAAGLSFSKGIGQEDQQQQMASLPSQPFISPVAPPQPQQQPPQSMNGISAQGMAAHDQMMGGMFAPQGGQPVQVADSSGYFPPAPDNSQSKPVQSGDRMQFYARQLSNPFLSPENKKLAMFRYQQELERQQQASDPRYQMGLEKDRLELDALRQKPQKTRNTIVVNGHLVDTETGQQIADYSDQKSEWSKLDDNRLYNPRTGEVKRLDPSTPAPKFDEVSGLRKEIQQLPSYKNYAQAMPIYRSMFETAGRNSKASDLNLVYGLGKIMDPTSVVREGEMVMVKNASSLPDWLQGVIASLNGGAALAPDTRRALMTEAYGRVQGYDQAFQQDAQMYQGIVERNRMNRADVIPDFGAYKPWEIPSEKALEQNTSPIKVNSPEEARKLPSGTSIILPDGSIGKVP